MTDVHRDIFGKISVLTQRLYIYIKDKGLASASSQILIILLIYDHDNGFC